MTLKTSDLLTNEYAEDARDGKIVVSMKVRQACERHLNDLKRQGTKDFPYIFDEEKAARPINFIQQFCRPSQGNFKRLELQPWQHFIIGSLYGWVHKDTGFRRFKEGLTLVGRKNGKSTMVSGLSLYGASKDGENGARVYLLANSMKQARVVFDECKNMVKKSPLFRKHFDAVLNEIRYERTFSRIEPQASDSEKLDGLNCHLGIFDEIHEYKDYKLINVIKNSTGAREQPLILYITTAGYQLEGPLIDYYEKAAKVLTGEIRDERTFYYIAEIDEDDDPEDYQNWIKANPNMGVTLNLDTLIEEWESRKHVPAERADFITKRLDVFVKADELSFIDYEALKRNDGHIDPSEMTGQICVGGFDLSQTEDFTSACLEFPLEDGRVFLLSHSFVPEKKVKVNNEKLAFRELEAQGLLTICPGDYVDYSYVYDWFVEQSKQYRILSITYDPANAYRLVSDLEAYGFKMEIVRQGHKTLNGPMKDLKNLFLDGKVIFNWDRLLRWYINNVRLVQDRNGNWMPTKQDRYRKIDGFAALLNAHSEVMKLMTAQKESEVKVFSFKDLMGR